MSSYIALLWESSSIDQAAAAAELRGRIRRHLPGWSAAIDQPGMYVAVEMDPQNGIDRIYGLVGDRGVLLGRLFERAYIENGEAGFQGRPREVVFDDVRSANAITSAGESIRGNYWGRYVAFLLDSESRKKWVLRDPSGAIPCQEIEVGGVSIYFARLEDLDLLGHLELSINPHFVIGSLLFAAQKGEETAYREIATIPAGQRVEHFRGRRLKTFYWDGGEYANSFVERPYPEAVARLGHIVRSSIHAWASCFERISLQLSGGLDSSIVAACLASAPTRPTVTCLNLFGSGDTTDERVYAREAAARFGFTLLERPFPERGKPDLAQTGRRCVIPTDLKGSDGRAQEIWRDVQERGAEVLIRGDGGDDLFYRFGPLPDASDLAFYRGLTPRMWPVAMNDAMVQRDYVWGMLGRALKYGYLKRPFDWRRLSKVHERNLFTAEARRLAATDETLWHPMERQDVACSTGKKKHLSMLLKYTASFHPGGSLGTRLLRLSPLISQPHLEFSLETPLHQLRSRGRDRGMARDAFADDLPSSIVNRRYKGLITPPNQDFVGDNLDAIRQALTEGYLVRERIVDRHALDEVFARHAIPAPLTCADLKSCMEVEVWVRNAISYGERTSRLANLSG